ncbi:lipase family protein [Nocardia sp. NBC_01503]|uniref:alpha/beta fold hydrolase n=1 Tax=Nocardia sp. NBC_01503 TaxID=2975997 RepID=UPI002E7AD570|nr:alpha/beta fold hydrolase [Nocardia sp. NBC_01503]WTL35549.1 lipase family protein [Nocardia sp. NBC_01503]
MRLFGWRTRIFTAAVASAGSLLMVPGAPAQAAEAGAVIDTTARPDGWRGMSNGSAIDYWTTRSNGEPVQASGALIIPPGPAPVGGWPIMAYDHGTSGLGPGCGGQSDTSVFSRPKEDKILQYFVDKGFAVVAPDYLGLGKFDTGPHPYLETRSEASATVDLVKAAREAHPELSKTWALTGFSQGGHAALGAANLQASTAPDLDFRGTIAVDPASDVEKFVPLAGPYVPEIPGQNGNAIDGFVVSMLVGLRETHPELDLNSYLTPRGREIFDQAGGLCFNDIMKAVDGVSVGEMLARPLGDERFRAAINEYMTVPTSGYNAPILLLLNVTDMVVPSPLHAALAAQFAANGVDFSTVTGTGQHTDLNPQMWSAIDAFTARVLATPTKS